MPNTHFDTAKEIPDLSSKVILITGGTNGLGYESALSFAAHSPAHIFFTGRSQPSADKLLTETKSKYPNTLVTFIKSDLSSLASVQAAAKEITSKTTRLDILMANAGIMALPPGLTKDGYELQFGTNHVGHALLIKLLLPLLETTAAQPNGDARIVITTSLGYKGTTGPGIHFDKLKTKQSDISPVLAPWIRYGQSKLANLLYARALAKHHPSITSVSIHPGISATNLVSNLGLASKMFVYATTVGQLIPPEQCAWNQQWAATAPLGKGPRMVESGVYYEPVGVRGKLTKLAGSEELAEKLWVWTQKELEGWDL